MGGTNLDNEGPKNISRTYKRKLLGAGTFIELELLRIVLRTYMCFPGSEIQKKCFYGDRCVSRGDEIVICAETKKNEYSSNKTKVV